MSEAASNKDCENEFSPQESITSPQENANFQTENIIFHNVSSHQHQNHSSPLTAPLKQASSANSKINELAQLQIPANVGDENKFSASELEQHQHALNATTDHQAASNCNLHNYKFKPSYQESKRKLDPFSALLLRALSGGGYGDAHYGYSVENNSTNEQPSEATLALRRAYKDESTAAESFRKDSLIKRVKSGFTSDNNDLYAHHNKSYAALRRLNETHQVNLSVANVVNALEAEKLKTAHNNTLAQCTSTVSNTASIQANETESMSDNAHTLAPHDSVSRVYDDDEFFDDTYSYDEISPEVRAINNQNNSMSALIKEGQHAINSAHYSLNEANNAQELAKQKEYAELALKARLLCTLGWRMAQCGAETRLIIQSVKTMAHDLGCSGIDLSLNREGIVVKIRRNHHVCVEFKEIKHFAINMDSLARLHLVCLRVSRKELTDPKQILIAIRAVRPRHYNKPLLIYIEALAGACFAYLNGGTLAVCLSALIGGILLMYTRFSVLRRGFFEAIAFMISAFIGSFVASMVATYGFQASQDEIILASTATTLLLVPGFPIINGFLDMFKGYIPVGFTRLMTAAVLIIAASVGLLTTSYLTSAITSLIPPM